MAPFAQFAVVADSRYSPTGGALLIISLPAAAFVCVMIMGIALGCDVVIITSHAADAQAALDVIKLHSPALPERIKNVGVGFDLSFLVKDIPVLAVVILAGFIYPRV